MSFLFFISYFYTRIGNISKILPSEKDGTLARQGQILKNYVLPRNFFPLHFATATASILEWFTFCKLEICHNFC